MNVVDRVRIKMVEAAGLGTHKHKTQKQLERSIVVGKKARDDELLLESYYGLAQYWEDHESAEEVQLNLQHAFDTIVRLRGGKARLVPDDPLPLARIMEQRGRLHEVQVLYKGIVEAIIDEFGQKERRTVPFAERLLDVSLRMGSLDAANIQQQMVQRLRETFTPPTMQWYHPPQGEMRTVAHIEHMSTQNELGRYFLSKKDLQRALKEFNVVAEWRNTIRQVLSVASSQRMRACLSYQCRRGMLDCYHASAHVSARECISMPDILRCSARTFFSIEKIGGERMRPSQSRCRVWKLFPRLCFVSVKSTRS